MNWNDFYTLLAAVLITSSFFFSLLQAEVSALKSDPVIPMNWNDIYALLASVPITSSLFFLYCKLRSQR